MTKFFAFFSKYKELKAKTTFIPTSEKKLVNKRLFRFLVYFYGIRQEFQYGYTLEFEVKYEFTEL